MKENFFSEINISEQLKQAIDELNYEEATNIQKEAIPVILDGKDIIGRSSTGTGKTAAFGIPIIEKIIDDGINKPKALILCPTRELAMQISGELAKYSKYIPHIKIADVFGGASMVDQLVKLRKANLVVGTPGRIMDHMRRKTLKLGNIQTVVLDEADEMLNMGFLEDMVTILSEVPDERQTLLFSATMPKAILKITKDFQRDPILIAVDGGHKTLDTIEQTYTMVPLDTKKEALNLILQSENKKRTIIFCNTKRMVDTLVEYLNKSGFRSIGLHGDMRQNERSQGMAGYKGNKVNVLVATDVAARGIDVANIETVINYDVPQDNEYYIHRIGRTGRAFSKGMAITLITSKGQQKRIVEISKFLKMPITDRPLPTSESVVEAKLSKFIDTIKDKIQTKEDDETFSSYATELLSDYKSDVQIVSSLLRILYSKTKMQVPVVVHHKPAKSLDSGANINLQINIGRTSGITPSHVVGALCDETGVFAANIGKIIISENSTSVMLLEEDVKVLLNEKNYIRIKGHKASIHVDTTRQKRHKEFSGNFKRRSRQNNSKI